MGSPRSWLPPASGLAALARHGAVGIGAVAIPSPTPSGAINVAEFWHSRDFGETWELHTLPGGIAFDMSFPPGQSDAGFATVLGLVDSGLVQYRRGE